MGMDMDNPSRTRSSDWVGEGALAPAATGVDPWGEWSSEGQRSETARSPHVEAKRAVMSNRCKRVIAPLNMSLGSSKTRCGTLRHITAHYGTYGTLRHIRRSYDDSLPFHVLLRSAAKRSHENSSAPVRGMPWMHMCLGGGRKGMRRR